MCVGNAETMDAVVVDADENDMARSEVLYSRGQWVSAAESRSLDIGCAFTETGCLQNNYLFQERG